MKNSVSIKLKAGMINKVPQGIQVPTENPSARAPVNPLLGATVPVLL